MLHAEITCESGHASPQKSPFSRNGAKDPVSSHDYFRIFNLITTAVVAPWVTPKGSLLLADNSSVAILQDFSKCGVKLRSINVIMAWGINKLNIMQLAKLYCKRHCSLLLGTPGNACVHGTLIKE